MEAGRDQSARALSKDCNAKLRQLKQAFEDREIELGKNEFMTDDGLDDEESDPKTSSLLKQKRMLDEGRRHINNGIEIASGIGTELNRQNEKLKNSYARVIYSCTNNRLMRLQVT